MCLLKFLSVLLLAARQLARMFMGLFWNLHPFQIVHGDLFLPNPAIWAGHMGLPWATLALTTAAVYARSTTTLVLTGVRE